MAPTRAPALVADYLATLDTASEATRRQRRWALNELVAHTSRTATVPKLLSAPALQSWLTSHSPEKPGGSLPSQRARASAARALIDYAVKREELSPHRAVLARAVLELPAASGSAQTAEDDTVRRLLRHSDGDAPAGVSFASWDRFGAHLRLLAETGLPERALSTLTRDTVTDHQLSADGDTWPLSHPAKVALARWCERRDHLVSTLEGSDPKALWLRVAPAGRADGTTAPAGLPISQRGLRMAFAAAVDALRAQDDQLAPTDIAAVRRWAQRRRATATPSTS